MCILVLSLGVIWPVLYLACSHTWLHGLKEVLREELYSIRDDIDKHSLW